MTPEETTAQYGGLATAPPTTPPVNPAYQPQASQVYSTTNVQQTMTNPAQAPDYSDPFKLRDYFYNTPDVVAARNDVKNLTNSLNAFDTSQNQQQNYLENQTIAMPVITGEQANQARLGATQREALSRELLAKQSFLDSATNEANSKYQIAQEQRGQLQSLITATSGKAGISYADSYETALQKADKYVTKQAEEQAKEARKQAEKDTLRQMYLQEFGKLPKKGMSTKDISKKLGKSKAEQKAFQKQLDQLELQTRQTALSQAKSNLAQSGSSNQSNVSLANASSALLASRGTDGKADPNVYIQQRDTYLRSVKGSTPATFDEQFGTLLSGNEQKNLGISTTATRAENPTQKPTTQAQAVASGYAQRAQEASKILDGYDYLGSSLIGSVTGASYFPNVLKSSDRQKMEQAQRNFVNAVLRPESGAVISETEFANASKQYFAQPGDSQQVMDQKRANRETKIQNLQMAGGQDTDSQPQYLVNENGDTLVLGADGTYYPQ